MKMKMGIVKVLMTNDKYFDAFLSLMIMIFLSIFPYSFSIVPLNCTAAILAFGIILCIFYLLYDLTVSQGVVEKIKRAIKRLEEKWFLEKSSDLRALLDAERRESKRLEEECSRLNSRLESDRREMDVMWREKERVYKSNKEEEMRTLLNDKAIKGLLENVMEFKQNIFVKLDYERSKNEELIDKVRGLEEELRKCKQCIVCLNVNLDHERSKNEELMDKVVELEEEVTTYKQNIVELDHERSENEELKEEVERSKVVMEDKDVLVNYLQGELGKHKYLEDVKERELSALRCEIAELRCARGEGLRLEKKLKEAEVNKEELLKTVGRLAGQQREYSNQVSARDMIIEKIESLRDLFNQKQVVIETQGIAKSLLQDRELEKADSDDTRSNDDEGYEVVCDYVR